MSSEFRRVTLPFRCANLRCSNEAGGGRFQLIESPSVAGSIPIALYVCAPCAQEIMGSSLIAEVPA
jgi:hypothetical protein